MTVLQVGVLFLHSYICALVTFFSFALVPSQILVLSNQVLQISFVLFHRLYTELSCLEPGTPQIYHGCCSVKKWEYAEENTAFSSDEICLFSIINYSLLA
jgi:hypothetical protein